MGRGRKSHEGTEKQRQQVQARMLVSTVKKIDENKYYGYKDRSEFINTAVDLHINKHERKLKREEKRGSK